jgi:acyl-coenzyme A thioesterase PaaI-like protein
VSPASTTWPPEQTRPAQRHPDAPAPGTVLPTHYEHCFGCGPSTPGGLRITTTAGEGLTVHAEFVVAKGHQGAPGLAHGGLLAAAFDETLGSLAALLRLPAVTGKLETDFRRPVPVDSTLFITATVDGIAGRKIYESAEGRLDAPDGPVAVRARALFVVVGMEHFIKHGKPDQVRAVFGRLARTDGERDFEINP